MIQVLTFQNSSYLIILPNNSKYFTTTLVDSLNQKRGRSPSDYWFDNKNSRTLKQHAVWAQRNSYAVHNGQYGSDYTNNLLLNGNDSSPYKTAVVYQMGSVPPGAQNDPNPAYDLMAIMRKHFQTIGK